MPAFHDSVLHHLKHVIDFDDNKRIVAQELSTVSENTELPTFQVQSTSADVVLGWEGFQTQRRMQGGCLGVAALMGIFFKVRIHSWRLVHNTKT